MLYHFKDFYHSYETKLKKGESLISHIVHNSNAKNIDPIADADEDEDWFRKFFKIHAILSGKNLWVIIKKCVLTSEVLIVNFNLSSI